MLKKQISIEFKHFERVFNFFVFEKHVLLRLIKSGPTIIWIDRFDYYYKWTS